MGEKNENIEAEYLKRLREKTEESLAQIDREKADFVERSKKVESMSDEVLLTADISELTDNQEQQEQILRIREDLKRALEIAIQDMEIIKYKSAATLKIRKLLMGV